jgi:hypothetical protein
MSIDYKICPRCKEKKEITKFYVIKSGRQTGQPSSYCKNCVREYDKDYIKINKVNIRARVAKYRYGITEEEYDNLPIECAICFSTNNLHIDHDHITGRYRGVLCGPCNRGLGIFRDNIELLKNAID